MKVLYDLPYDKIGSFAEGNPYCIAFVYTHPSFKKKTSLGFPAQNFIIKGGANKVNKLLEKEIGIIPAIVHKTFWYHKQSRISITFYNVENVYKEPTKKLPKKWLLFTFEDDKKKTILNMKRIPRKWIKELNPYISTILPIKE